MNLLRFTLGVSLIALVATTSFADPAVEKEQLAVLRSSDSPKADKAIACKKLAIHGSSEAVADLAKLLPDPELHSWARIALEAIPGPAANEALRKAAESLDGLLLVGTINSIGVRRDADAIELLSKHLQDKDAEIASAAAVALGKIGGDSAVKSLKPALAVSDVKVRSAVAEGCVLSAERFHNEGKSAEAVELYDIVRKADVPKPRVIEATRGAILARNQDGIPMLMELFKSADKGMFNIALSTVREFPGKQVDQALAAEIVSANPDRAALMIQAMADRQETVVLSAVLKAAGAGPKPVRLSAISALGRVGDATCLQELLDIAVDSDADLSASAKTALAELPGEKVNSQLAAMLPSAKGKTYPVLIELVGQRRIEATPALLKALDSSDKTIRGAALAALGETVSLKNLNVLIDAAVSPKNADDAAVAQQALKAAAVRMPDREACAAELAAAFEKSNSLATKTTLLQTLGAVGGTKSLSMMSLAGKSSSPELQDASTRLLGEWMTADAAPVLLDLSNATGQSFRVRALRGYIRIARQFVLPDAERTEMCQKAFAAAQQPAEKKLVIDILKRYPNIENLKLAIKFRASADVKDEATAAAQFVAQKLGNKGEAKDLLTKAGIEPAK